MQYTVCADSKHLKRGGDRAIERKRRQGGLLQMEQPLRGLISTSIKLLFISSLFGYDLGVSGEYLSLASYVS